jgi:TatD DNase family protein
MSKIIDTHAHYYHGKFNRNRDELMCSMKKEVGAIINIGTNMASNKKVLAMLNEHDYLYSMIGFFPNDVMELEDVNNRMFLEKHIHDKRVVGIGEIGLDYHWDALPHDIQEKWFRYQIELAIKNNMPVSIHSREAEEDTYRILKDYDGELKGVVHCYSYGIESAKKYAKMGLYFGVGGTSTYKGNRETIEAIKMIPMKNILLETDAPYLSPEPVRREVNDSRNIIYVAENLGKIKGLKTQDVLNINAQNVKNLFGIEV